MDVEVDQERQPVTGSLQVRDNLGRMHAAQRINRLQLDHQSVAHQKIQAPPANRVPLVCQIDGRLANEREPSQLQFNAERLFVD